jgi:hypothetical protein
MTSCVISTPHTIGYYAGNMTRKNGMSRVRGTYEGVEWCIQTVEGKQEGKRPLVNPRRSGEDNIKSVLSNGMRA